MVEEEEEEEGGGGGWWRRRGDEFQTINLNLPLIFSLVLYRTMYSTTMYI